MSISKQSTDRKPEDCVWRALLNREKGDLARCRLLQQLFGDQWHDASEVTRDVCTACCNSFPPTFETLNPVLASLVFDRAGNLARARAEAAEAPRWRSLCQWAERYLEVEPESLPETAATTGPGSIPDPSGSLRELLPPPARCGELVQHWSVGVTTAPRRRSCLNECLRSLAKAGWPRPHLFIDGAVEVPGEWSQLPTTRREEQVGAWPNYYLSLLELLMREPLADAFMIVQDDALFYCQESLRQYLEEILWPGKSPGIVSLYCASPDTRPEPGWSEYSGRWKYGAVALVFPRAIAQRLVIAPSILRHRWAEADTGRARIPEAIAEWAAATSTPFYFPTPSLVQHIGETSTIWLGSYQVTPARKAGWFLDDHPRAERAPASPLRHDTTAEFPEDAFPCAAAYKMEYQTRIARGRRRMAGMTAVVCGLCRDLAPHLSATIARFERIADMFQRCGIVIFENDSIDDTPHMLSRWATVNPAVRVVSERLEQPASNGGTNRERTERMAYYRNRCRERVLEEFDDCDVCLVADMDLHGGWSYDGLSDTFAWDDWDFVGSNGLRFIPLHTDESLEFWDMFAYRAVGQLSSAGQGHALNFRRGEPLVPVWSCFGGLGVYRMDCFKAASYNGADCEHVAFHQALRARGFDRLFLNPSQIVLYSPWNMAL